MRFRVSISRRGIETHHITRNKLEVLQAQRRGAISAFCPRFLQQIDTMLRPTIHGVVETDMIQSELIRRLHADGHLLNRAGTIVAAGPINSDIWRISLIGSDEVILRKPDRLSLIDRGDMVSTILLHGNYASIQIALPTSQVDLLPIVK